MHPARFVVVGPANPSVQRGATVQFMVTSASLDGANPCTRVVTNTWTSSNTGVATVDNLGLATTLAAGTTTIQLTVTDGGCNPPVTGSTTMTVT